MPESLGVGDTHTQSPQEVVLALTAHAHYQSNAFFDEPDLESLHPGTRQSHRTGRNPMC